MSEVGPHRDEVERVYPVWWDVQTGPFSSYAIKATSFEEASDKLADELGFEPDMCMGGRYAGEKGEELEERYSDREIVVLIPLSSIEMPIDPDNMTDEQRTALDHFKNRPLPPLDDILLDDRPYDRWD